MFPGILFLLPLFVIFVNIERSVRAHALRHLPGADHHLPDLLAAVLDLDARRVLRLHPARARGGGAGRRRDAARRAVPDPHPGQPAGHRRRRDLRLHHRLGRGPLRLGADHRLARARSRSGCATTRRRPTSTGTSSWPPRSSSARPSSSPSSPPAVDRARADRGRGEVVATTTPRGGCREPVGPVPSLVASAGLRLRARRGRASGRPDRGLDDDDWIPVDVPGDVHRALIAAGRIAHPFYDRNEDDCAWMEEREWWYRLALRRRQRAAGRRRAPAAGLPRPRHVRHGLAERRGARPPRQHVPPGHLRRHRARARGAANVLAICFDPPLEHARRARPRAVAAATAERVSMRKAQFGYGWDWGPRLPTIGLWRPVELRRERRAALTGVHAATARARARPQPRRWSRCASRPSASPATRRLTVARRARRAGRGRRTTASVGLRGRGERRALPERRRSRALWWTHDLGEPALHDLRSRCWTAATELDARERAGRHPHARRSTSRPTPTSPARASSASCSTAWRSSPGAPTGSRADSFVGAHRARALRPAARARRATPT